jgi:hypothetical protein
LQRDNRTKNPVNENKRFRSKMFLLLGEQP